ncbi:MAG TPA: xylose isomerase [Sphingobacteriaceae bacterium]|nr:xylose isomerase [Sphingobacteriaceae bacterium]
MKLNRQDFLKIAGLAGTSMVLDNKSAWAASEMAKPSKTGSHSYALGITTYSFRNFSLDQAIEYTKKVGITKIAIKDMHIPLKSSPEEIRAMAKKIRDAGLDFYSAGVLYMKSEEDVNIIFEYAKNAGVKQIIGVPNHDLLPLVEKKVKEYDIKVGIHNHGPTDKVYPSASIAYEKIKNLDKRMGLCIDIGHATRSKEDPSMLVSKYKDRLFDVHLKDLNANNADIEVGRGVIDIPRFLKTMDKIGYTGNLSFEFEKDGKDPLAGIAESIGYVKGVLKMI